VIFFVCRDLYLFIVFGWAESGESDLWNERTNLRTNEIKLAKEACFSVSRRFNYCIRPTRRMGPGFGDRHTAADAGPNIADSDRLRIKRRQPPRF